MKKCFLFLIVLITSTRFYSQVAFCPAGALWHYSFKINGSITPGIPLRNLKIAYSGDTIINNENVKILKARGLSGAYYGTVPAKESCIGEVSRTFIRQRGDTVFFNNGYTLNGWQILYNFATPVGGFWVTHFKYPWPFGSGYPNATPNYTVNVNSVETVTINGMSLKRLHTSLGVMTERLGADYLFYFPSLTCDGANFNFFLCYEDNMMGLYKATEKSCDYEVMDVGIEEYDENASISIYPNPAKEGITLESPNLFEEPVVILSDLLGKEVMRTKTQFQNSKIQINVSELKAGVYFLKLVDEDGNQKSVKKIIKE